MDKYYKNHLAAIHDKYFGELASNAAKDIATNIWANLDPNNYLLY